MDVGRCAEPVRCPVDDVADRRSASDARRSGIRPRRFWRAFARSWHAFGQPRRVFAVCVKSGDAHQSRRKAPRQVTWPSEVTTSSLTRPELRCDAGPVGGDTGANFLGCLWKSARARESCRRDPPRRMSHPLVIITSGSFAVGRTVSPYTKL